jgi:hypothetical protein
MGYSNKVVLGILIVGLLAVVAGSAAADDGWIAGKVYDNGTAAGVSGATVTVQNGTQTATTDASGNYNITVANGTYSLKVTKSGYVDKIVDGVVVTVNNTTSQNIGIDKVTGYLTGTIKGDDGAAIQYASVTPAGYLIGGITDANGKYNITKMALGSTTVTVSALGYPDTNFTVTIVAGQNVKDVTLVMETYVQFYITGPTILGIPMPLEGATVTCGNATGTTDSLGMAKLVVKPGSYKITISAKDYKTVTKDAQTVSRGGNTLEQKLNKTSGSSEEGGMFAGILAAGIAICLIIILLPIIIIILIIVWLVRRKKNKNAGMPPAMPPPPPLPPPQGPPPAPPAPPQA